MKKSFLLFGCWLFGTILLCHAQGQPVRNFTAFGAASGGCQNSTTWTDWTNHTFGWCDNGSWRIGVTIATSLTAGQAVATNSSKQLVSEPILYADQFAGADFCAKVSAAFAAIPAGSGTVDATGLIGAQSCAATAVLNKINSHLILGPNTILTAAASVAFTVTANAVWISGPQGTSFELILPVGGTGISTNSAGTFVSGLYIYSGAVGIDGLAGSSNLLVDRTVFREQTTAYIRHSADTGLNDVFSYIDAASTTAITTTDGIKVSRTTTTDLGDVEIDNVRITTSGAARTTTGINITSSVANTIVPIFLNGGRVDATESNVSITNITSRTLATNMHLVIRPGSSGCPVNLNASSQITWVGGFMSGESTGTNGIFCLSNAVTDFYPSEIVTYLGPVINFKDASAFSKIVPWNVTYSGTGLALSNNTALLRASNISVMANDLKIGFDNLSYLTFGDCCNAAIGASTSIGVWRGDAAGTAAGNFLHLMGYSGIKFHETGSVMNAPAAPAAEVTATGFTVLALSTETNCADSAGAAACGSASAGAFVIDAAATSTVVSTTAVTANSQIFLQEDSSLGTRLGITCNTQSVLVLGSPVVTARTAATSFTATTVLGSTTTPVCVNYWIVN